MSGGKSKAIGFVVLTYLLSWSLWTPLVFTGLDAAGFAGKSLLLVLGACMPSIVGLFFIFKRDGKDRIRQTLASIYSFKRIGAKWLFFTLLIFPMLIAVSFLILYCLGKEVPSSASLIDTITNPVKLLIFIIMMLIGGPIAEEIGWRGYLLGEIQAKMGAVKSSILVGILWGVWHVPLFLIKGTTQGAMGLFSLGALVWFVQVVFLSGIYTVVFNHTNQSILAAILLHFMWNSTGTLITQIGGTLPLEAEVCRAALLAVVVSVLYISIGKRTKEMKP